MNYCLKDKSEQEKNIAEKVFSGKRINNSEALYLFEKSGIDFCGFLANHIKEKRYSNNIFYNKNIHLEISNICINKCNFCSFYREKNSQEAWNMDIKDILEYLKSKNIQDLTEIHIVGALHPDKNVDFYKELFRKIKNTYPHIHLKALTAVEIEFLAKKENKESKQIISELNNSGMDSLAGGGAEILDDKIRKILCPDKTNSESWLRIHREAHELKIPSNCTMLYGHTESYADRINHFEKLRKLQDITGGFNCFIPLKYKAFGNNLNINSEIPLVEELKNYAISRIYFDNIPHIKAYWPMCGKETAFLSLCFGIDDLDGTINDTTKIYSMAGSDEQNPDMNSEELKTRCKTMGFDARERDSLYNII